MRTPWRFVADLVSRKPKAELPETPASPRDEIKALEYQSTGDEPVQETKVATAEQTGAAAIEPAAEPEGYVATLVEPSSSPAEPADVAVSDKEAGTDLSSTAEPANQAPAIVTNETARAVPERLSPAPRKSSVSVKPEVTERPGPAETTALAETPKTYVEELAALDLEVAALRRQYATKLAEQNAQLRKMLVRFEKR